jgi:hypothetical protein
MAGNYKKSLQEILDAEKKSDEDIQKALNDK